MIYAQKYKLILICIENGEILQNLIKIKWEEKLNIPN